MVRCFLMGYTVCLVHTTSLPLPNALGAADYKHYIRRSSGRGLGQRDSGTNSIVLYIEKKYSPKGTKGLGQGKESKQQGHTQED